MDDTQIEKIVRQIDDMLVVIETTHRKRVGKTLDNQKQTETMIQTLVKELIDTEKKLRDMYQQHVKVLDDNLELVQNKLNHFKTQVTKEMKTSKQPSDEAEVKFIEQEMDQWVKSVCFPLAMTTINEQQYRRARKLVQLFQAQHARWVDISKSEFYFEEKTRKVCARLVDCLRSPFLQGIEKCTEGFQMNEQTTTAMKQQNGVYSFQFKPSEKDYGWRQIELVFESPNPFSQRNRLSCVAHIPRLVSRAIHVRECVFGRPLWTKDGIVRIRAPEGLLRVGETGAECLIKCPINGKCSRMDTLMDEKRDLYVVLSDNRNKRFDVFEYKDMKWNQIAQIENVSRILGICNRCIHVVSGGDYCLYSLDSKPLKREAWCIRDAKHRDLLSPCSTRMSSNADGSQVCHVVGGNELVVMDTRKRGEVVRVLDCPVSCEISQTVWTRRILFACSEHSIFEFDTIDWKLKKHWSLEKPIEGIAVSVDESILAVCYHGYYWRMDLFRID